MMTIRTIRTVLVPTIFNVLLLAVAPVNAADNENEMPKIDILKLDTVVDKLVTGSVMRDSDMLSYCLNISDLATETRTTILQRNLKATEEKVDAKLDMLTTKITALRDWTARREKFLATGKKSLIKIFQTMRPDAAAQQLSEMGPVLAASIIIKLAPKNSSAILTEMKPAIAAKIATVLTTAIDPDE